MKPKPPKSTADSLGKAILDRLISLEKRMDALQREAELRFESLCENLPSLISGETGGLLFRGVLVVGSDDPSSYVVVVNTASQKKEPE